MTKVLKDTAKELKPLLETIKYEPMDDLEIQSFIPHTKIIKYSELSKVRDLNEILPKDKDYLIILFEFEPNKGHWVALMKDKNIWNYFDSFGKPIDSPLKDVPTSQLKQLGIYEPYLTNLLKKEVKKGKRVVYNKIKYQGGGEGIATCGRFCCFRILNFLNGIEDEQFYNEFKDIKDKTGLSYDELVSFQIPETQ
jgi:hypothetical protein